MHETVAGRVPRVGAIARRLPAIPTRPARARVLPKVRTGTSSWAGLASMAVLAGALLATGFALPMRSAPAPTRVITPPLSKSWLHGSTILSVYGRSFGTAPILGRLGMDRSFADLARQVEPYRQAIAARIPSHHVVVAVHLIYGLATPCTDTPTCILYLDDTGINIARKYIEPAAKRGWLVILDDQLGRSNPEGEMNRLISRGYMRYDNVEVAFDPEYRVLSGGTEPGVPVGDVSSRELNVAQRSLSQYVRSIGLPHRKLMLVHQWTSGMITNRRAVRTTIPGVQPVSIMDAFGPPSDKTNIYRQLMGRRAVQRGLNVGIKLFPPNPYEQAGHLDTPVMNWNQLFGRTPVRDLQGFRTYLSPAPRVIVMT